VKVGDNFTIIYDGIENDDPFYVIGHYING
jgi:hypothetical protein